MSRRVLLSIEYQRCRTWGHAWDDFIPLAGTKRAAPWGRRFSLRCDRCGTERHDTFDSRGELSTRHYDYPEDYRLNVDETPSLQQLRLSIVRDLKGATVARAAKNGHSRTNGHKKARRLQSVS